MVDLTDAQGRQHILDGDATGGGHGPGRTPPNLEVDTPGEILELFDRLSAGGTRVETGYPGELVDLPDGKRVGLRLESASGGETIDVWKPGSKTAIKVHLP